MMALPGALPTDLPAGLPADLPAGLLDLAGRHWSAAQRLAERAGLQPPSLGRAARDRYLAAELTAPLRLEVWPSPSAPRPVSGGWVHDEVIDEDRPAFEDLLARRAVEGAEVAAAAAQELRWPVTPYRTLRPGRSAVRSGHGHRPAVTTTTSTTGSAADERLPARRSPPVVVDLSTHWAGPLSTAMLARAGARVIKVDPDARPDGFRGRPDLYRHLNGSKETIDLDLRDERDRARFERLVTGADLLVESFSRRVLPNLGYDRPALARLQPDLALLSIRAFPAGTPEAGWLAYGPGVHATSGLGMVDGRPSPAPVAYPDWVAGVAAYARAVALLAGGPGDRSPGGRLPPLPTAEISLAGAIAPLIERVARSGDSVSAHG